MNVFVEWRGFEILALVFAYCALRLIWKSLKDIKDKVFATTVWCYVFTFTGLWASCYLFAIPVSMVPIIILAKFLYFEEVKDETIKITNGSAIDADMQEAMDGDAYIPVTPSSSPSKNTSENEEKEPLSEAWGEVVFFPNSNDKDWIKKILK